jgi:hypothetical protein
MKSTQLSTQIHLAGEGDCGDIVQQPARSAGTQKTSEASGEEMVLSFQLLTRLGQPRHTVLSIQEQTPDQQLLDRHTQVPPGWIVGSTLPAILPIPARLGDRSRRTMVSAKAFSLD